MVNHYRDTIRIAARHHLMVEAHEMVKDTGERLTYPNIMTREAVRGIEWEAWSEATAEASGEHPVHADALGAGQLHAGHLRHDVGSRRPRSAAVADARDHAGALYRAAHGGDDPAYLSGLQMMADVPEYGPGRARARVPRSGCPRHGRHEGDQRPDRRRRHRRQAERAAGASPTDEQDRDAVDPTAVPGLPERPSWPTSTATHRRRTSSSNPDEVRITRIIVDSRDRLIAPMTGGSGQAVHLEPASWSQVRTLPHCGSLRHRSATSRRRRNCCPRPRAAVPAQL